VGGNRCEKKMEKRRGTQKRGQKGTFFWGGKKKSRYRGNTITKKKQSLKKKNRFRVEVKGPMGGQPEKKKGRDRQKKRTGGRKIKGNNSIVIRPPWAGKKQGGVEGNATRCLVGEVGFMTAPRTRGGWRARI